MTAAQGIRARPAGLALTAALEYLQRHPVALGESTPGEELGGGRLDRADHLVAGYEGKCCRHRSGEHLMIGAAQPAGFYPQDGLARSRLGQLDLVGDEPLGRLEHQSGRAAHACSAAGRTNVAQPRRCTPPLCRVTVNSAST